MERKRIGLAFSYSENWIAGTYYIFNMVHAMRLIPDEKKPHVVVITSSLENFNLIQKETAYPYLEYFQFPFPAPKFSLIERAINKASRIVIKRNLIRKKPKQPNIEFLYPNEIEGIEVTSGKRVNWVPDFQEKHLPHLFTEEGLKYRENFQKEVVCEGDLVVLSSEDSLNDFNRFYPHASLETFVIPFAVTHPDFSDLHVNDLLKKYQLPTSYFLVPNQFWAHKNHKVVIEAVAQLVKNKREITVAFSGKENDYRNKDYVVELKKLINELGIEKNIVFLGFIDRKDQLGLMDNALAIVQPSLFEGWSTVVEDAKAVNTFLIASSIEVHKEQVSKNVLFFDPHDVSELTNAMEQLISQSVVVSPHDYGRDQQVFSDRISELIEKINQL